MNELRWAATVDVIALGAGTRGQPSAALAHGVLVQLALWADRGGANSYPAVDTIAMPLGSNRRTVQRVLRWLESVELVRATGVSEYGTTVYALACAQPVGNVDRGRREAAPGAAQGGGLGGGVTPPDHVTTSETTAGAGAREAAPRPSTTHSPAQRAANLAGVHDALAQLRASVCSSTTRLGVDDERPATTAASTGGTSGPGGDAGA